MNYIVSPIKNLTNKYSHFFKYILIIDSIFTRESISESVWNMNLHYTASAPSFSLEREWVSDWGSDLPLHLSQSFTRSSCICRQSLVLPRSMVKYSWWRRSFGMIFMAPNFTHSIFDPLSCTGTQWIGDKVMINWSLHSPHFPDILASEFSLGCWQAWIVLNILLL